MNRRLWILSIGAAALVLLAIGEAHAFGALRRATARIVLGEDAITVEPGGDVRLEVARVTREIQARRAAMEGCTANSLLPIGDGEMVVHLTIGTDGATHAVVRSSTFGRVAFSQCVQGIASRIRFEPAPTHETGVLVHLRFERIPAPPPTQ